MAQAYRLSITLEPVDGRAQVRTGDEIRRVRLLTHQGQAAEAFENEVAYLARNLTRETVRDAMVLKAKA